MAVAAVLMGSCGGETKKESGSDVQTGPSSTGSDSKAADESARTSADGFSRCFLQPDTTDPLVVRMLKRKNDLKLLSVVDCQHSKDLVDYYNNYVDTDPEYPLTKFVVFPTKDFVAMAKEWNGKADYVRVYFGATPVKFDNGKLVSSMTVMFKGAKVHNGDRGGYEDVPCKDDVPGARTYNVGTPCPPPRCPGISEYYDSTEMDQEPK